jgi:mannan endo-1,4-beta-mannosidase
MSKKNTFYQRATTMAFSGLFLFSSIALFSSCGGDDDDEIGGGDEPIVTPTVATLDVVSCSISNGSVLDPDQTSSASIKYSEDITLASSQLITLNGQSVSGVTASGAQLSIPLSLDYSTSYTLTVGAKAVSTTDGTTFADSYSISFTTSAEPEPDVDVSMIDGLSNPDATQTTQNVYNYLLQNYGKKILSASMANVNWNTAEADLVYAATGKHPAINTFDYIHLGWSPANWIDYTDTKVAKDWWDANGLIAAGWHWMVPTDENNAEDLASYTYEPGSTTWKVQNIFVEGTWEQKTAQSDLAKMAQMLKLLQDEDIPVIWRPLHEAAGNIYEYTGGTAWFWWGYDGAETYVKLWRYMYDFFKEQGVNNLIWVWTSTGSKDHDFYPGDEYVDIVGRDLYSKSSASLCASEFLVTKDQYPNKMVTLSECGSVAKISEQWSASGCWSYFMPWYSYNATTLDGHDHADTAWWTDAMQNSHVLSREDLPSLK